MPRRVQSKKVDKKVKKIEGKKCVQFPTWTGWLRRASKDRLVEYSQIKWHIERRIREGNFPIYSPKKTRAEIARLVNVFEADVYFKQTNIGKETCIGRGNKRAIKRALHSEH